MLEAVRVVAVLVAGGVAAYTDARRGYIHDWLTYPLIGVGVALNVLSGDAVLLVPGAVVFALGYLLYFAGKVGGGDVKLLAGIAWAMPFYRETLFVVPVVFVAALAAMTAVSGWYLFRYLGSGVSWEENRGGWAKAGGMAALVAAYLGGMTGLGWMSAAGAVALGVPLALGCGFLAFEDGIKKRFFEKWVSVEELEEDEAVARDSLPAAVAASLTEGKGVLGEREVAALKAANVKKVKVYRGLPPFAPFVFLGVVAALAEPQVVTKLVGGF